MEEMFKHGDYILDGTFATGSHWNTATGSIEGKQILLVDFDHTLTTKCLGCWDGNLDCEVQVGAKEALEELHKHFWIYIYTGDYRYIDPKAQLMKTVDDIKAFLDKHQIPYDKVLQIKPPAMFIVDDRAVHHLSWKQTLAEIKSRCSQK